MRGDMNLQSYPPPQKKGKKEQRVVWCNKMFLLPHPQEQHESQIRGLWQEGEIGRNYPTPISYRCGLHPTGGVGTVSQGALLDWGPLSLAKKSEIWLQWNKDFHWPAVLHGHIHHQIRLFSLTQSLNLKKGIWKAVPPPCSRLWSQEFGNAGWGCTTTLTLELEVWNLCRWALWWSRTLKRTQCLTFRALGMNGTRSQIALFCQSNGIESWSLYLLSVDPETHSAKN